MRMEYTDELFEKHGFVPAVREAGSMFEEHMELPCAFHPKTSRLDAADAALIRLIGLSRFLRDQRYLKYDTETTTDVLQDVDGEKWPGVSNTTLTLTSAHGFKWEYIHR